MRHRLCLSWSEYYLSGENRSLIVECKEAGSWAVESKYSVLSVGWRVTGSEGEVTGSEGEVTGSEGEVTGSDGK